jgi:hypothetical protein
LPKELKYFYEKDDKCKKSAKRKTHAPNLIKKKKILKSKIDVGLLEVRKFFYYISTNNCTQNLKYLTYFTIF